MNASFRSSRWRLPTPTIRSLCIGASVLISALLQSQLAAQGFGSWTQVATVGPPPRYGHAMAFDSARGRVVLFGGQSSPAQTGPFFGETWEWDGTTWTLMATNGPSPRWESCMAYDSFRRVTVLYGGETNIPYGDPGDTWEWDGTNWTLRATSGPSARDRTAMAYDSLRHRIVLFGGHIAGVAQSDTWEWDGTNWTAAATNGPPARYSHAMTFDSGRGRVVLFGGFNGSTLLGDTWEWDGTNWTEIATGGPSPGAPPVAYDSLAQRTILFGGITNTVTPQASADTWAWDGNSWSPLSEIGAPPANDYDQANNMVYDSVRGNIVLFPGHDSTFGRYGDTWELASSCLPPPSGLVGWWPAESNANDIVATNNGTLVGGVTFAPGKVGEAFALDGASGYVTVPDSPALDPQQITIEGWFYLNQSGAGSPCGEYILASKYLQYAGWILRFGPSTTGNAQGVAFSVHGSGTFSNAVSSVLLPLNTWVHLAGTYDGTAARIYVNGVETGSVPFQDYTPSTVPMVLGASSWVGPECFLPGRIDEFSVYNRALSPTEIQAIFQAGSAGKCKVGPYFTKTGTATLNGAVGDSINLNPGDALSGSFPYSVANGSNPNAIVIVAVGLVDANNDWVSAGGIPQVVYNGIPPIPGTTGTATWSGLAAPPTPGSYQLRYRAYFTTSAATAIADFEANLEAGSSPSVGFIDAGNAAGVGVANPHFTKTGTATLNGAVGDSIVLNPGDSLSGSFPYSVANGSNPNAIVIVAVGLVDSNNNWVSVGGTPQVVYNGIPPVPGTTGTATWSGLAAPAAPGNYQLRYRAYFTTSAATAVADFEANLEAGSSPSVGFIDAGNVATITVHPPSPPTIISSPTNSIVGVGGSVTLCVAAGPSTTLQYQWLFNDQPITNAADSCLTLEDVSTNQSGLYSVKVSNSAGSVTSSTALLSVFNLNMYAGVTIVGEVGAHYRIDYLNNIQDTNSWTTLTTITLPTSPYLLIDTNSTYFAHRFYRAVLLP